jgi:formyl-CoA transferase
MAFCPPNIGKTNTGEGQFIDASLFDSALAFSIWDTAQYWGTGIEPYKLGTANHMSAPYQAMKASDGYFVMGATNQKLWKLLCEKIGRPELIEDARFKTNPLRLANRLELASELEKTFVTKSCVQWVDELLAEGIPAGPINTYPEAFRIAEHGKHRKMRMEIDHPIEGKVPNIGFAVKMMGTPQQVRKHPPLLGEHNAELLAELGIAGDELRASRGWWRICTLVSGLFFDS